MEIVRDRERTSNPGGAENFTGHVRIEPVFAAVRPSRAACANVTFDPGARTAWHTHPLGQRLVVLDGVGRVQREGHPPVEVHAGDVIWFEPGEKHWHGAAPHRAMTHLAIQEHDAEGKVVDWLEKVSDDDYRAGPRTESEEQAAG
jgi:quercetin dioxygenase-like cupin family protein